MPITKRHQFTTPTPEVQRELLRRAVAAWVDPGTGQEAEHVAEFSSYREHKGLGYVVLWGKPLEGQRDDADVLAVYHVRPDNLALRRLVRWPAWVARRRVIAGSTSATGTV